MNILIDLPQRRCITAFDIERDECNWPCCSISIAHCFVFCHLDFTAADVNTRTNTHFHLVPVDCLDPLFAWSDAVRRNPHTPTASLKSSASRWAKSAFGAWLMNTCQQSRSARGTRGMFSRSPLARIAACIAPAWFLESPQADWEQSRVFAVFNQELDLAPLRHTNANFIHVAKVIKTQRCKFFVAEGCSQELRMSAVDNSSCLVSQVAC